MSFRRWWRHKAICGSSKVPHESESRHRTWPANNVPSTDTVTYNRRYWKTPRVHYQKDCINDNKKINGKKHTPKSAARSGSGWNVLFVSLSSSLASESILHHVRSLVSVGLYWANRDANDCLTFFEGRARALEPLCDSFLNDLTLSEMDLRRSSPRESDHLSLW